MSISNQAAKVLSAVVLAGMSICAWQGKTDQKLAPADLIAKHLDSMGPAEARARVNSMRIKGTCLLTVREGGNGRVEGQAVMASRGNLNLINMTFDSPVYPYESLKYDGKNFVASQFKPGLRTPLAQFFLTNDVVFREGIVGGILSASWPLLNLQDKNPKLEYAGLKKIGGKQMHALKYTPRKSSELKITLFFDPDTFQHLRTDYERIIYATELQRIPGGGGAMPEPTNQRAANARINAFEEFSEFRPEGGLILPHTYKFGLAVQSDVKPALVDWTISLADFNFSEVPEFNSSAPVKPN